MERNVLDCLEIWNLPLRKWQIIGTIEVYSQMYKGNFNTSQLQVKEPPKDKQKL